MICVKGFLRLAVWDSWVGRLSGRLCRFWAQSERQLVSMPRS